MDGLTSLDTVADSLPDVLGLLSSRLRFFDAVDSSRRLRSLSREALRLAC